MSTDTPETRAPASPERFDPAESGGRLVHSEHIARYRWAAQIAGGAEVLDAGCGTGYGTALLADAGPRRLVAFDIAQEAVERTRSATAGRAEVRVADICELPFDDDSFDVAVCFEVIEHLERRSDAVRELARVLKPDGVLLISSPNRNTYPAGNEHHVHEYTPQELRDELLAVFAGVDLYRQHAWLASTIAGDGSPGAGALEIVTLDGATPDEELFTIAVAGRRDLPSFEGRGVLGDPFEVKWWLDRMAEVEARAADAIAEAEAEANDVRRRLAAREEKLADARNRIAAIGARLIDVEQQLATLQEARESEKEQSARELGFAHARIERADVVLRDMQESLSWRVTKPLRAVKRLVRR